MRIPWRLAASALLALLIPAVPLAAAWEHYPAPEVIEDISPVAVCLRVEQPPDLEVAADESAWAQVRPAVAWVDPTPHCNRTSVRTARARFIYDDENIYVYFSAGPVPTGEDEPPVPDWSLRLTIDPRPDHINTPHVNLKADGSASISIVTWKKRFRDEEYKSLPQPQGRTEVASGSLRGKFAIPIAGLMADPPAPGDTWDLDFELWAGRITTARWATEFIPGRLLFVSQASPPAYYLTRPKLSVTPHHGRFVAHVSVKKWAGGPPPTEVLARGIPATGREPGATCTRKLSPERLADPIALVVEMPEPGWGAIRFELRRGTEVIDTLVLPVEVEPALPRFADLAAGSLDCYVRTLTVGPGDSVEGHLGFAPAQAGVARVEFGLEAVATVGTDVPDIPSFTPTLSGEGPATSPFSFRADSLPCGIYRVAGTVEAGGESQRFESQPINVPGQLVTDNEATLASFEQRLSQLAQQEVSYPFQRDCAEMLLILLGRHGPEEFEKLSASSRERRGWWPVEWAVQLDGMLKALEQDRDYFAGRSGVFVCAYRSRVDGTLQPYQVTLPEGFDRERKWPVLFGYHGTHSHYYYGLIGLIEWGYQPITKWPMIGVALEGRCPPTQHGWLADVDFLECYEQVREHFGMDPARVSMTGFSRGGRATWYYATHTPHLFAAIAPCAPFGYMHTGELPNVRHTRVCTYHGVHDPRCAVGNGPVMIGALTSLGGSADFTQFRVAGHDCRVAYRDRRFVERLIESRAEPYPKEVEFVSTRPRYARAYWVTIERLIRYGAPASVSVRVTGPNALEIQTKNVGALSLDLSGGQVQRGKPLSSLLNGEARQVKYADNLHLEMERVEAGFVKTPECAGPIGDWLFGKSLIVYGTEAGGEVEAACKQLAAEVSRGHPVQDSATMRYVSDVQSAFPIKADEEVVAEDVRECNLVLLGGPGANSITSRIADRLPVRFEGDGLVIGGSRVSGSDASVAFIYPNPEMPERYVVVLGVADPAQKPTRVGWASSPTVLRELNADLLILSGETELPSRLHFDARWQLQPPRVVCEVPAGNETTWDELRLEAVHRESGADVAFRFQLRKPRIIPEGSLYEVEARAQAREEAAVAFKMTGSELTSYLASWITLYAEPPLLRGITLDWSIDPNSKVVRINGTDLKPDEKYEIVADEMSLTRACWTVPEHVQYRVLPVTVAEAVLKHIELGKFGTGRTADAPAQ